MTLSEKIAKQLRYDLYSSVINKDIGFFDRNKTGDLLSRLNSDTAVIQDSLSNNVSMFVRSMVTIIVTLVILIYISPQLTYTTFGSIFIIVLIGVVWAKIA
jgi:ABC-type multidrug transport system fused ATPase/permease subunit